MGRDFSPVWLGGKIKGILMTEWMGMRKKRKTGPI